MVIRLCDDILDIVKRMENYPQLNLIYTTSFLATNPSWCIVPLQMSYRHFMMDFWEIIEILANCMGLTFANASFDKISLINFWEWWLWKVITGDLNIREPSQLAHDVRTTLLRRRFNVLTSFQRLYNVVLTSCASWDTWFR